jgi:hypothetical protein
MDAGIADRGPLPIDLVPMRGVAPRRDFDIERICLGVSGKRHDGVRIRQRNRAESVARSIEVLEPFLRSETFDDVDARAIAEDIGPKGTVARRNRSYGCPGVTVADDDRPPRIPTVAQRKRVTPRERYLHDEVAFRKELTPRPRSSHGLREWRHEHALVRRDVVLRHCNDRIAAENDVRREKVARRFRTHRVIDIESGDRSIRTTGRTERM